MNVDQAIARACQEPTLIRALSWIAIWDTERVVKQAIEWNESGISMASHGGGWDTCFEYFFVRVQEAYIISENLGSTHSSQTEATAT